LVNDGSGNFVDETRDDGNGRPRLPTTALRPYRSELVDLDADGDLDIVVVSDVAVLSGLPTVFPTVGLLNDGSGHFLPSVDLTLGAFDVRGVAWSDLNADGKLDLVLGNATGTLSHEGAAVRALLGKGAGEFATLGELGKWDVGVFAVAAGDVNGDGVPDLFAAVAEPNAAGNMQNILLLSK
jgi:hypothetical protein